MFTKVLIPVDVSTPDDTQKLLGLAKTLTDPWDCELHVLTVIPNVGMAIVGSYFDDDIETKSREAVAAQLQTAVATSGIKAKAHIRVGSVYDAVIEHANSLEADLIVIGAHQPELKDYLLGPNAARVVRHSKQSVLVVRD